jgi:hypothetical protein
MKYVKHLTFKEWNRFKKPLLDSEGNYSMPGNEFQYRNFNTQKIESLQTITGQELLLSKYIIILDNFEPKWTRRYHLLKKYVNQKNLNKGIKSFNKAVNAFSSGLETTSSKRKSKKDHDILFGKKKASIELWGKKKNVSIWGEKTKRRKKYIRKKREEHDVPIW